MKSAYLIFELSADALGLARSWLTAEIRRASKNETLYFPETLIPDTGLCVRTGDGRLLAVISLYIDRTRPVGYAGWCVANPANSFRESHTAIGLLLDALPIYAGEQGCEYLFTQFGNRSINRMLDRKGYQFGEETKSYVARCHGKG